MWLLSHISTQLRMALCDFVTHIYKLPYSLENRNAEQNILKLMTNPEKLNAILYLLLNEVRNSKTNPKLTFEFICRNVCEVEEDWEIRFLMDTLVSDEYIFINPLVVELPKITPKGIKFIQIGGYKNEVEIRDLDKKIKVETLKSLKRSKLSLLFGIVAVIISGITSYSNYYFSIGKNQTEKELKNQKKTIDSIANVLKNQKLKLTSKP